ncbi:response regulator [Cytobacillus sp. FJAT-54145]|uniref:Response regulator n=1 Tax=Cytobacillus spartinae TaxID=3299023 RepID=A0ABW6KE51_9BACI
MIRVFIVEDDPMVAELNRRYLESIEGFKAVGTRPSVDAAKQFLKENEVDLILLDVYMPGEQGLALLPYIRQLEKKIDVILITAASDIETIQGALRFGAIDYLIKPFSFDRLKEALVSYQEKTQYVEYHPVLSQQELDEKILKKEKAHVSQQIPKGLTKHTLKIIWDELRRLGDREFSTEDIAKLTGISRVSIRKYLNFLEEIEVLETRVCYGTIGRPINQYVYNEEKGKQIGYYL